MSYNIPANLLYSKDHEWVKLENGYAWIGITDYAQATLGDIVYLDLPEPGKKLEQFQSFGSVESIKSVSDLFSPVTGEIVDVNKALASGPEKCNQDVYGSWMIKVKVADSNIPNLLGPEEYRKLCSDH